MRGGENTCRAAHRRDPASAGSRTKKRGIVLIFRPWVIAGSRTLPYPPPNGRPPFLCPRSLSAGGAPRGTPAALHTRTSCSPDFSQVGFYLSLFPGSPFFAYCFLTKSVCCIILYKLMVNKQIYNGLTANREAASQHIGRIKSRRSENRVTAGKKNDTREKIN